MTKKHKTTIRHIISIIGVTAIFVITCYSIVFADTYTTTYDTATFDVEVNNEPYQEISDGCSGAMDLLNPNEVSGNLLARSGDRYGSDICKIEIIHNNPSTQFSVFVGNSNPGFMSDGTNAFSDADNAGGDCLVDTSGNTEDEEFGYRIQAVSMVSGVDTQVDPECSVTYDATTTAPNEYIFDIEYGENPDEVFRSAGSGTYPTCFSGDCSFNLKVAANVEWNTYADTTYSQLSTGGSYTVSVVVAPYP